jgi:hypothetical protein
MDFHNLEAKDDVSFGHGCLCERHGGRPAVAVQVGQTVSVAGSKGMDGD